MRNYLIRPRLLLPLLGLLFAGPASAQVRNATNFITPLGYCQLTTSQHQL